jgi:hypothetical protein
MTSRYDDHGIIRLMRPLQDGRSREGMARLWTNNAYLCIDDRAGIQRPSVDFRLRGNDTERLF